MTATHSPTSALNPLDSAGGRRRTDWSRVAPGEHLVQYYDDDAYLLDSLRGYVGDGLRRGEAAVVIVTPEHRRALELRLVADGIDLAEARSTGRFVALDAAETLARFMENGTPNAERFARAIGPVLTAARGPGPKPRDTRAYGEMVALLWDEGNHEAAIRLEELWNDLAAVHPFALLCGYSMKSFAHCGQGTGFERVCKHHTRVIPAEGYESLDTESMRAREIARLQQRAAAMEAELLARQKIERDLTEFLDNALEGVHRVGPDGRIQWANRAELDLLGYERDEYVGRNITEFHADREVIDDILARLLRGETIYNRPARLIARDGSMVHVLIHSNGRWEAGEFRYTRCFTRDVTAEKRAQDERDALLAREQATRRDLEMANADLRDFAHIVSHDLREPLRGIGNYASFLESDCEGRLDEEAMRKLKTIQRLTRRSYDLLDAIMAVSRVGRDSIELQEIEASTLISQSLDNLRGRLEEEGVTPTVEPCTVRVRCDPRLAVQALTNLIGNGLKYNESAHKTLRVGCATTMGERERPVFFVQDNGIGIDPRHQQRIFQMFKRLHRPGEFGGGTGAGLAIVQRIVERHGGRVWVESRPGLGSTFFLTLGPDPTTVSRAL